MRARVVAAMAGGMACLLVAAESRAQCGMDNDCAGDQICESGVCSAPVATPPAAPLQPAVPANPTPAAPAPRQQWQQPSSAPTTPASRLPNELDDAPRGERHSRPLIAGGIMMLSLTPLTLIMTFGGIFGGQPWYSLAGVAGTGALAGVGIPMIVIGARRRPVAVAQLAPWVTPQTAGLGLELRL